MFVGLEVVYTVFVGSGDFDAIRYHDTLYTSFVGGDKAVDCGAFGRLDNAFYNGNGKVVREVCGGRLVLCMPGMSHR